MQFGLGDAEERFVVQKHGGVRVVENALEGENRIVRLHGGVGDQRRWRDGKGKDALLRIGLPQAFQDQGTKSRAGTAAYRVSQQEALERLGLFDSGVDHIHDLVDDALPLDIVTSSPVVGRAGNLADDAAFIEKLRHVTAFDPGDHPRLKVHQNSTGDVFAIAHLVEENLHVCIGIGRASRFGRA